MHVSLPVSNETILMGSDQFEGQGPDLKMGNNFSIMVQTGSRAEADKLFNALAEGGQVIMPLADTFWGSYYGMCTDQFGISWMMSYDLQQEG